jgi:ABC-2 type transport system permease protein
MRWWRKYFEVARTNLRSRWAYLWDQVLSTIHLAFIMFVFVQLWKVTYASSSPEAFAGYSLPEVIWYLVGTEAIITSLPRIHSVLASEVKNGDLAIRLNKPYSYLLFHYSAFLGEGLVRLATSLAVGGLTAYLLVGGFAFRWEALPVLLLLYLSTTMLHFFYSGVIGLAAFWVEDVFGLYLLLDRLKWMLGGMLLPVELYPAAVRRVVEALPFQYMIAAPARLFVKFSWAGAAQLAMSQAVWLVVFGLVCTTVYRLGVRRVDVNGG